MPSMTPSKNKHIRPGTALFAVLLILVVILAPTTTDTKVTNVQPALLAMAATEPNTPVRVVIQKSGATDNITETITQMGGAVIKELNHQFSCGRNGSGNGRRHCSGCQC